MTASTDSQLVTLDRAHFDTLVRRANFNRGDFIACPEFSFSKAEYDDLRQTAAKYANLRRNLERGGVDGATIDLLSKDDVALQQETTANPTAASTTSQSDTAAFSSHPTESRLPAPRKLPTKIARKTSKVQPKAAAYTPDLETPDWADDYAGDDDHSHSAGEPVSSPQTQAYNDHAPVRPHYERQCARSILLLKLPDNTTHRDITDAVRGGQLLDIYLRSHDRAAVVSFLIATDAKAFFNHVKRHDLYIKNKRVEIRWNERQFILPGHVAHKIHAGATRNLIIRRCNPRFTEQMIRDDLDHIHNLAVIKVDFKGGSCHIQTNSVHNAMFAKTCMMSRAKYKGSKIDWDVDQCNQPLGPMPQPKLRNKAPTTRTQSSGLANRFNLLNIDDEEDPLSSTEFGPAEKTMLSA